MFFLFFLEDMAQKNNMQNKIKRQEGQELQASLSCTVSHTGQPRLRESLSQTHKQEEKRVKHRKG